MNLDYSPGHPWFNRLNSNLCLIPELLEPRFIGFYKTPKNEKEIRDALSSAKKVVIEDVRRYKELSAGHWYYDPMPWEDSPQEQFSGWAMALSLKTNHITADMGLVIELEKMLEPYEKQLQLF